MDSPSGLVSSAGYAKEKKTAVMGDDDFAGVGELVSTAGDAKGNNPAVRGNDFASKVVVLKLDLLGENDKKKAMKVVSRLSGVDSMSIDMEKSKLTVTGNVDPIKLVNLLRKNWPTDLVSVGPSKNPDKQEPKKYKPEKKDSSDYERELFESISDWPELEDLEAVRLLLSEEPAVGGNKEIAQMNKVAGKHLGELEMSLAKDHIIGIDDQVERITELMNMGSDRVLVIGICGPDGIGKTSLAKAVYNQLSSGFDAHCFLEDIKEEELMTGDIRSLQFKVARDILWSEYGGSTPYGEGFEVLKEVLPHMKVLIVLDDLEHVSYIKELTGLEPHLFGLGSMIIVTTKGGNFSAKDLGEDLPVHYCVQPVSLMNADLALQLFNLHVFGKNSPGPDYSGIAKTIVNGLKGYPLLIEVIGSLLHSKEQEEFKELSKRIDPPTLSFSDLLKVAYEALDEIQQRIFLDIACCIANEDVQTAKYMWYDCLNSYPNCIVMPLAKLGYGGELWMHSSLRHFGQQIVRAEDKGNSGICSRVFVHQIAMDIMRNGKGTEPVEALCLDFGDHAPEEFTAENFKRMPNLRFLRLDSALITGDLGDVFPKLRWLKWQRCPIDFEATNVHAEELVILDLSGSAITEDWKGWDKIKMVNLKVLNLANCGDLITTPRFESFPNLNRLILEGCVRLIRIDPSICTLKCLVYLNLKFCRELNNVPEKLGDLEALRELWVDGTGVEEIPIIDKMKRLESLSAPNCHSLGFLPYSIGKLEKLRELSLGGCRRLQELPDSIGELGGSLLLLDISGTGIAELPELISGLQSLKVLKLDSCFLSELPETVGCLHNLEEIHASRCRNLKDITPKIGELRQLRILELRYASISIMPESIENLHKLETLDLLHCDNIEQLPHLPSSLKVLHVNPELQQKIQFA